MIWLAYRVTMLPPQQCRGWLNADEWHYAGNCGAKRAQQFCNGRMLIRQLLQQQLGLAPADVGIGLPSEQAPKLVVNGQAMQLSLSHSAQAVAVAVSASQAIGLDVEQTRSRNFAELAAQYPALQPCFSADSFYRRWTAAEAYSKFSQQSLLKVLAEPLPQNIRLTHLPLPGYMLCLCYQDTDTTLKITGDPA
jgi:phosphopantetheinyl transferase